MAVHIYIEGIGEVESTEPATCADCGAEGLRGNFPGEGGMVGSAKNGRLICDACGEREEAYDAGNLYERAC